MKRSLLTAALVLTFGAGAALAQQAPPPPQDTPQGPPMHHHQPNPQREAEHLARRLNLTPDQTAKLEPILANRQQQIEAIHNNGQLTQQDARLQMRALQKSTHDQLAAILTPEQLQQMKEMRRGPHGPGGPHGQFQGQPQGGQPQGPPPPSGF